MKNPLQFPPRSAFLLSLLLSALTSGLSSAADRQPNIILVLTDDLGYGDLSCYGSEFIDTPRIDKMASLGVRATRYRVAANICTPSRAALLTGSYPQRAGMSGGISPARPEHRHLGLNPNEITIAEMLKAHGYATGMIGKWHLGFDEIFHPLNQGFDSYYGMPSNFAHDKRFFKGREVIAEATDLTMLVSDYTSEAITFIEKNAEQPFFLYLAHNYPHLPLKPNPAYKGKSRAGDYGDIIVELDTSMGTILDTLDDQGIADNTLIIFTSDNGPVPKFAQDYQSAGPLRGSKYVTFEGGHRVPAIFYWPGRLPTGNAIDTSISAMDILPTIAAITGAELPNNRTLDGKNIWPILIGESKKAPREIEYYYNDRNLQAVRKNNWKMHLPRTIDDLPFWHKSGKKEFQELAKPFLVNLASDIGESQNIASTHPEIVEALLTEAATARRVLGSVNTHGIEQRSIGDSRHPVPPNIIVIFIDDLGYGDLGCFGSTSIKTPHIDQLAVQGMRFTDFYAQPICGPSRAALMTGCYPMRVAERDNTKHMHPHLHSEEITIAEILKNEGYATGCFGKWDLAKHSQDNFHPDLMPNFQGFDYFYGTPTSNDGKINLYRNENLIEEKTDMATVTRRYTDEAIGFIERNQEKPFFVYLPHSMPHTRLDASGDFKGKSDRGLYGDVVEEIDFNVGRIMRTLEKQGLIDTTYVFLTSDNGPWLIKNENFENGYRPDDHGGSAAPFRSGKVSNWEGGVRVPTIAWAPGRIPQNTVCENLAATLDLLPTIAKLAGGSPPSDRIIDGEDISHLLSGNFDQADPDKTHFYYFMTHLQAVRQGQWKLHLPRPAHAPWLGNMAVNKHIHPSDDIGFAQAALYDLNADPGENNDLAQNHPEIVRRLSALAESARADIGDHDRVGKNMRFFDPMTSRPKKPITEWKEAARPASQ